MVRESEAADERTLDEVVRDAMAEWQIPGVTVAVLHDGKVETHGYGVISLETNYPTRPDTLFQVGSNSKVFTATLVMRLVEAGLLDLDTPIGDYLPDLRLADPRAATTVTLRHLLSHTSGVEGDRFEDTGEGDDAVARYVAGAGDWAQNTAPGEFWSYCNSGFGLAGRIVEVAAGTSFEAAMKERVFVPLGLERSFYFAHEAIVYSAAAGHTQLPGEDAPHVALPYHIGRRAHPAGGIIASAGDLLAFLRFHMGNGVVNGERVLTVESIRAMQEPQVEIDDEQAWGIGWGLRTIDGARVIEHGGGTNGHITQMLAVPEQTFGLVILTNGNRGGHVNELVEKWALARYCGLRAREPEQVSLPLDQL
ncbi:MAG: beta-lactamase, partial [Thermomicrobiales bacterium]|nr:beta-lactamase [Thermomicrobiales bacterium]